MTIKSARKVFRCLNLHHNPQQNAMRPGGRGIKTPASPRSVLRLLELEERVTPTQFFTIGDGSPQRSIIPSLTATFDSIVTLDPGAIEVKFNGISPIALNLNQNNTGGKSVVTVEFPSLPFGSLGDGAYTVTLHHKLVQGMSLNDDIVESFHRLFGDGNGDAKVNATDFALFRGVFGVAGPTFDFDNNGVVNALDFAQFRATFGSSVQPAPSAPYFGLAASSDSEPVGDHATTYGRVTLVGQTTPFANVELLSTGQKTIAGSTGTFQIPDVNLKLGANALTVRASVSGPSADFTFYVERLPAAPGQTNAVQNWNQILLEAIRLDASSPPVATRGMAMVHGAILDVVNAIDGTPSYMVHFDAPAGASASAAVASTAHRVLSYLYPGQQATFDSQLAASLSTIPDGQPKTDGINLGIAVGNAVIALRANDGWNTFVVHSPSPAPGAWVPTPPMYAEPLLPQWGQVTPFVLTSADQFLPAGPPSLTSQKWADDFNDVKSLGSATSTTRTADQTQIARFWADGGGSYTPPGHWNHIAQQVAQAQGDSLSQDARLFAALNFALADAAIAAWYTKYFYDTWRPVTAIRNAGQANNPQAMADSGWTPLLVTPPFPEYVSGHSTFSRTAATILSSFFGDSVSFSSTTPTLPGVTRNYTSFDQAVNEAGRSRIYGGIHFEFANQDGQAMGKSIADWVLGTFAVSTDVSPPVVTFTSQPMAASKSNVTITGQVFDNLAGVNSLQARMDFDPPLNVTFDKLGQFKFTTSLPLDGTGDGKHVIHFTAKDALGNSITVDYPLTLDTKAPQISIVSPMPNDKLAAGARLTGKADGTGTQIVNLSYAFDVGPSLSVPMTYDPSTGAFDVLLDLSKLSVGAHTLTVSTRDAAGNLGSITFDVTMPAAVPLTIANYTPQNGDSNVGSTYRPKITFSRGIVASSLTANNFYATDTTGSKLPANITVANDGTFAWLFFSKSMPSASTVTIHVDGSTIQAADGSKLDAAGNGVPGSALNFSFSTVSLTSLSNTSLIGTVADPGPDLKPGTFDDVRIGPDGVLMTADDVFQLPIANVKVYILGQESQAVFTDAKGQFTLASVPSGNVKLVLEGQTATNAPAGIYFPEMVMDLTIDAGYVNTVMGSMGTSEQKLAHEDLPGAYLPRVKSNILNDVSSTAVTHIGVNPESAPNLTPEQQQLLSIDVQPGSLIGADGMPLSTGKVGISTVPPELVRDMLPPGVLQHTFDITVQAPGIATFAKPAPMTFPNVFNAEPGSKLNFLSFDHTTGRLVIEGTVTVSPDGKSVTTDPGMGITHPGWHGVTPPGECVEVVESEILKNFVQAAYIADEARKVTTEVNGIFKDLNNLSNGSLNIPTLPPIIGGILDSMDIAENIGKALDTKLDPFERLQAGSEAILTVGLLFAPVPGGLIFTLGRLVSIAVSVDDAADSLVEIAESIERKVTEYKCDPTQNSNEPHGISAPDALPSVFFRAGVSAEFEAPILNSLQSNVSDIASILSAGDPNEINMGLDASQISQLKSLLDTQEDLIDQFDNSPFPLTPPFWNTMHDAYVAAATYAYGSASGSVGGGSGGTTVSLPPPLECKYWSAEFLGQTVYGKGRIEFFAPPNTTVEICAYDCVSNKVAQTILTTGQSGIPTVSNNIQWVSAVGMPDADSDGLVDIAECAVGTSESNPDTDGDGINDLAEVLQGLDPLGGRSVGTGNIASLPLQGEAKEVVIEGSTQNPQGQTAYVATGSFGLAIVNATQFQAPLLLGQLDLPGDATDVAVDAALGAAAVATNVGGLHFVDVSNPIVPSLNRTVNVSASQVEIVNGVVYATVGSAVQAFDLLTGESQQVLSLSGSTLISMAREGFMLYTLDSGNRLQAIDISGFQMVLRGSLTLPTGGGKIFVANGIAYVGAGNGFIGGFVTANIANPDSLVLLSGVDANNIQGASVVANGSGLAVSVGTLFGVNSLDIVSVSDPTNTGVFITRINLPAVPSSVALAAGIAFVANGTAGLQVVNYQGFDNKGKAPTVTISTTVADVDPTTPGVQVVEGTTLPILANVSDDVQVRNVELLVNGKVIRNDVSFPFDLAAIAPSITPTLKTAKLEVRVTDTGGNSTVSNAINLDLVPDTVAPTITGSNPSDGSIRGKSLRKITIQFNEPLDSTTVSNTNFRLLDNNGLQLFPTDLGLRYGDRLVQLTFDQFAPGDYQLVVASKNVTDRAGNALGTTDIITDFSVGVYTSLWVNPAGGSWSDAANWDTGKIPGPTDDVLIDVPNVTVTITHKSGADSVASLTSNEKVDFSGGTLSIAFASEFNNEFALSGGTLTLMDGATSSGTGILRATGGAITVASSGQAEVANLTIANGFALQPIGNLVVTKTFDWMDGGNIYGPGKVVLGAGSKGTVSGTANRYLAHGGVLEVGGSLEHTGGPLLFGLPVLSGQGGTLRVLMGGNLTLSGDGQFINNYFPVGVENKGSIVRTGAGETNIAVPFKNEGGVIDNQAGTLKLTGGGTWSGASQLLGGGLNHAGGTTTFLDGTSVSGTGQFNVTSGALAIAANGKTSLGSLGIDGGVVSSATGAELLVTGTFAWTGGGNIHGPGKVVLGVGSKGTVSGSADRYLAYSGVLEVSGSLEHAGGPLRFGIAVAGGQGGTLRVLAGGSLTLSGDGQFIHSFFPVGVENKGTILRTVSGETVIGVPFNNQGGVIDNQGGTLTVSGGGTWTGAGQLLGGGLNHAGGTTTFLDGTSVSGTGQFNVTSGTLAIAANGKTSLGSLGIDGGVVSSATGAELLVTGTFAWTGGGNIHGPGKVVLGAGSKGTVSGIADRYLAYSGVLEVGGSLEHTGGPLLFGLPVLSGQGGTLRVLMGGNLTLSGDGQFFNNYFAVGVDNKGTILRTGSGETNIGVPFNNTGGVVDSQGGTLKLSGGGTWSGAGQLLGGGLNHAGGTTTFLDGTSVSGTGQFNVTSGALAIASDGKTSLGALGIDGGVVYSATGAELLVTGAFAWTGGGNIYGPGKVVLGAGSKGTVSGSADRYLANGGVLEVSGSLEHAGGPLRFGIAVAGGHGGTLRVLMGGNLTLSGDGQFINNYFAVGVENKGSIVRTGAGETNIAVPFKNEGGVIDNQAGTLKLTGGGTWSGASQLLGGGLNHAGGTTTFLDGTSVSGTGQFNVTSGALAIASDGKTSLGALGIDGGVVYSATGAELLVTGAFAWTGGGNIYGPGKVVLGAGSKGTVSGIADRYLAYSGVLEVGGSLEHAGGPLRFGIPVIGGQGGTLRVLAGGSLTLSGDGQFINNYFPVGVDNQGAIIRIGTGTTTIGVPVTNSGVASVQAGTLSFISTFTNQGQLQADNGGTLTMSGLQPNTGTILAKVGGTITINGNFTNTATGTVSVEIGGPNASDRGNINITGVANLAGTLVATLVNGYMPTSGASFTFMTFASAVGSFTTFNGPGFSLQQNSTNLTLLVP